MSLDSKIDLRRRRSAKIVATLGPSSSAPDRIRELFEAGVFAMPIGFPTVPKGLARIRVMNTAAHSRGDLDLGLEEFAQVGKKLAVI